VTAAVRAQVPNLNVAAARSSVRAQARPPAGETRALRPCRSSVVNETCWNEPRPEELAIGRRDNLRFRCAGALHQQAIPAAGDRARGGVVDVVNTDVRVERLNGQRYASGCCDGWCARLRWLSDSLEAGIRTPITWSRAGKSESGRVGRCRIRSGSVRGSAGGVGRWAAGSGAEFHNSFTGWRSIVLRGLGGPRGTRTAATLVIFLIMRQPWHGLRSGR
jgi:hypothetical protein